MNKLSYRRSPQDKIVKKLSLTRMMRPLNNPYMLPKADPRVEGVPNQKFLEKHNLDEHSRPMDWFVSLMPITQKDNKKSIRNINVTRDVKTMFTISN